MCFRQEGLTKKYVVQAMNKEERTQWMDAMEGKEPVSVRVSVNDGVMGECE